MKFISTRGKAPAISISEALLKGLAQDGGLFVPETWPSFDIKDFVADQDLATFAIRLLSPFFDQDPLQAHLEQICRTAFHFPIPLRNLDANTSVLELFHGPTSAFKDFGARFLALSVKFTPHALDSKKRLVLVATSGDTGGAVAAAFQDCTDIPVAILYPKGGISTRQEKQLCAWGEPIHAFRVQGQFDDCQRMVKEAFLSSWWQDHFQLISANSINIGRLLPQMAYYAFASLQYFRQHRMQPGFIIPSGNLGNAVAAFWAHRLGFPIRKIIMAHNANAAVPDFYQTGRWLPQATISTLANAMDVGNPSNFERLRFLFPNLQDLQVISSAISVPDEKIRHVIQQDFIEKKKIWCPHTATAALARKQLPDSEPWVIVATAHPAKFESIVEPLIGQSIPIPENLKKILSLPSKVTDLQPDLESLQSALPLSSVT